MAFKNVAAFALVAMMMAIAVVGDQAAETAAAPAEHSVPYQDCYARCFGRCIDL